MWISRKKLRSLEKRIADLERRVRSQQSSERQYHGKTMVLISKNNVVPTEGYATVTNVLSNHTTIQFAVPSREWNELEKSEEWTDFQVLLEKTQEAFYQQMPPTAE